MNDVPTILFVCVHNAGRSQMGAGYARTLGGDRVRVLSGGSEAGSQINPIAVAAMAEDGIDISGAVPQLLKTSDVQASDAIITMGCGDACPVFPGKRYEDWELTDPAGKGIEEVRPIRDETKRRVAQLLAELLPAAVMPGRYRHFKGGEYEVVLVARDVETEEPVVVYQALYGERGHWVRSLADFTAWVSRDGYEGPRFVRAAVA
jgi:arsenate reductase